MYMYCCYDEDLKHDCVLLLVTLSSINFNFTIKLGSKDCLIIICEILQCYLYYIFVPSSLK